METPILLIIFNRPDTTRRVFEAIRKVKPLKLYVTADGPRLNRNGEVDLCKKTRQLIENIDWLCEVHRKYYDENHGCDPTIEAGLNWFFENEEKGIILEDDCLPDITFFKFAEKMLEKYKDDKYVMHVNGSNFQEGIKIGDGDYYFSRYSHSWGWATWRRSWKLYNHELSSFPGFKKNKSIDKILKNSKEKDFWLVFFQKLYIGKFPFWDSRWTYTIWENGGVSITPNENLIENIGWGKDATHTNGHEKITDRPTVPLLEIRDPSTKNINEEADVYTFFHYYHRSFWQKLLYKLRGLIK